MENRNAKVIIKVVFRKTAAIQSIKKKWMTGPNQLIWVMTYTDPCNLYKIIIITEAIRRWNVYKITDWCVSENGL